MVDEENKVPAAASRASNKRAFDSLAISSENGPLQIPERPFPVTKKRVVLGEVNNLENVVASTQNSNFTETHKSKRKIKLRKTTTKKVVKETDANFSSKNDLQKCAYAPLIYQHLHSLENLALQQCTGYKPSELKDCVLVIHELQSGRREAAGMAVREKYMDHKYVWLHCILQIFLLVFLTMLE